MPKFQEEKQERKIDELLKKEAEDLAMILSQKYGMSYIDLFGQPINSDALKLINETDAREASIAPFKLVGKKVHVAVFSPNNNKSKVALEGIKQQGFEPVPYMASEASLEKAWERYKEISLAKATEAGVLDISSEDLTHFMSKVNTIEDIKKIIDETVKSTDGHRASKVFEIILAGAISTGASDIHIEPEEENVRLRFRLDGVLQNILFFDAYTYKLLLSRVKLLSGLKINIKDNAQDGRFSIRLDDNDIEIRTSTLPGSYGESIVMRILDPKKAIVSFEEMGVDPVLLKVLDREIKKPNGMILTTGPTGSGKSTTLYTFLRKVYSTGVKIITIEDPIEYHLGGITQTQTNKNAGYDFAKGMKSALRQDPDIIMVGEIRDGETATTAIHAALTGHLVFSTLHTNNAAGTIPRLIDLGVEWKVLSSALSLFMAQRLIRKLCENCKTETDPTDEEKILIENVLASIKRENKPALSKIWKAGTCKECSGTGYKGRVGVFEGILMDDTVSKAISEHPNEEEIKKASEGQNILDMKQDGIVKVVNGVTSIEELGRVIDLT